MKDDRKLATGISIYVRSGSKVSSREPELVLEQIAMVRSMGIRGFCMFSYDHLSDAILEALRRGPGPLQPSPRSANGEDRSSAWGQFRRSPVV